MTIPRLPHASNTFRLGLSATAEAVVALSRRGGADGFPFESSGFRAAPFQGALLARAQQQSVLGLILVELARSGHIDELTSARGFDAAGHLRLRHRQAVMWDLERDAVLARLSWMGILPVLLKGAALRLTAYRDSAERDIADLDLLVSREMLEPAVAALVEGGYEPESEHRVKLCLEHHYHLILKKPEGFVVEVHWALAPATSPYALDHAAFLREARMVTTPRGIRVQVPSPEHMVLHLAQQNLEDGFTLLRRLVDVDRVISSTSGFDWGRLASESKRMRQQGGAALTVQLAKVLLGTTVPRGFIAGLGLSAAARAHLALLDPVGLVLDQRGQRRAIHELLLLWCLPDLRARVRLLKQMGTGEWGRDWRMVAPKGHPAATEKRFASLLKLAACQALLYPAGLLRARAGTGRGARFWRAETRIA